jgi:hypothetical protein
MVMIKQIVGLVLGLMVLGSAPTWATTVGGPESKNQPVSENSGTENQPIVLAEESLPISEILHMDTANLVMLGTGVVVGALVIGPYLGVSELLGVGIGVLAGEALYQSHLLPFGERHWFE